MRRCSPAYAKVRRARRAAKRERRLRSKKSARSRASRRRARPLGRRSAWPREAHRDRTMFRVWYTRRRRCRSVSRSRAGTWTCGTAGRGDTREGRVSVRGRSRARARRAPSGARWWGSSRAPRGARGSRRNPHTCRKRRLRRERRLPRAARRNEGTERRARAHNAAEVARFRIARMHASRSRGGGSTLGSACSRGSRCTWGT